MFDRIKELFTKKLPGWFKPGDPAAKEKCPCCDYVTLAERNSYLICPVCFWEDEGQDREDPDEESGANHGITLREGRENFRKYGACEKEMVKNVLPESERSQYECRPDAGAL